MDFSAFINSFTKTAAVISVKVNPDGSFGELCNEACNDAYLRSVNIERKDFVPGSPYETYVKKDINYENMTIDCVSRNKLSHAYIDAPFFNAWLDIYMMPLITDSKDKLYCLFSYEMNPKVEAAKLVDIPPTIALQVMKITLRLHETDDFSKSINSVVNDLREFCNADRSCLLLTDYKKRKCTVLGDSLIEGENTPRMNEIIDDSFFNLIDSWEKSIAGSNCFILRNQEEFEGLKNSNYMWYTAMKSVGVYNLVLYPLRLNGEIIGYLWTTNFDSANTENIKATLEVATYILATEISNHQLFEKMELLSVTDLLTGLYNRNAMNNRITDIVNGVDPIESPYGVVFVDLNGLKLTNDRSGHVAGDKLLKESANVLSSVFTDCEIFRVGGDEFLVIVTGKSEAEFNALIDELRKKSEAPGAVKFAIGSCFSDPSVDIRNAMHIADEKMYQDKDEFYKKHPELKSRGYN